jgi:hypothetical protein
MASANKQASCAVDRAVLNSLDFPRRGPFRLHGPPSKGFESFLEFELDFKNAYDKLSRDPAATVSVSGVLRAKPNRDQAGAKRESYGDINSEGEIKWIEVIEHHFNFATLRRDGFSYRVVFKTRAVAGISYGFDGQFVDKPQFDRQYTSLTGSLTKYRNGQEVTKAKVELIEWTFE